MTELYFYNKESKMPVKMKASQVTEANVRYDLISITEEQYFDIIAGVVAGKHYHDNGIHVFELPAPNRAPKWFEKIEYTINNNTPVATIAKQPLAFIVELVSSFRKTRIANSIYSDRELNAFREMVDSEESDFVYVDRNGVGTRYTLEQAKEKLKEIASFRQQQFIIESKYIAAYELGYAIPNPTVDGNWDISVIDAITNKPVKSKKGK
jgi:hypothetical protein